MLNLTILVKINLQYLGTFNKKSLPYIFLCYLSLTFEKIREGYFFFETQYPSLGPINIGTDLAVH